VLTGNGGPANSTKVIAFYAYDQAFHYLFFGYGAAVAWLITAFMLVLISSMCGCCARTWSCSRLWSLPNWSACYATSNC